MKYSFVGVIIWGIVLLIGLAVIAGFITLWLYQQNGEHILILYKYMDSNNDPVAL